MPAALAANFGFKAGDKVDVEVSKNGILLKPSEESAETVMKWLREEHGNELATLTTDQIMHLLRK